MTFLIPRILTISAGAQHLFVVASCCQWMDTVVYRAGGGGATGSCSHHQPAQDQPTPARGRSSSPHRRAAPRHSAAAARPPRRGNTAGANLRRLLGLGVCSCAPISGTCGTQHRGLLTTRSPGYRQETRREAAATDTQSVTSGQCRSAESPSCHLPRYCRYSRHLYLHKSPPPPPPTHSPRGGCWTRCPRA